MNFQSALDRDMQLIVQSEKGIGVDVVFTDSLNDESFDLRGIFSNAPVDVSAGGMQNPFLGNSPIVTLVTTDIQNKIHRKIEATDEVLIDGISYHCQMPRYSTYGTVTVKLSEKKEAFSLGSLNK